MRALTLLILAAGCASAPVNKAQAPAPLFEFHSGFWLNLHQVLLAEGRPRRRPVPGPPHDSPVWTRAIAFYRQDLSQKFFLDDSLAALNLEVAQGRVPETLRAVLEPVAAEYRAGEWPEDEARSREWLAQVQPLIDRHGVALAEDVSRVFGTRWVMRRVELSKQAGPFGAVSIGDPLLITISTADPGYAGGASLEMLFHEASHGLDAPLVKALEAECARRKIAVPENLDHALLFFSVGELAKRYLGDGYVPYAYKNGVYQRGWQQYEAAMRAAWVPFLDGRVSREEALRGVIAAVVP